MNPGNAFGIHPPPAAEKAGADREHHSPVGDVGRRTGHDFGGTASKARHQTGVTSGIKFPFKR
jgi:hypothetical protein